MLEEWRQRRHFFLQRLSLVSRLGDNGISVLMNKYSGMGELYMALNTVPYPSQNRRLHNAHTDMIPTNGNETEILNYYLRLCYRHFYSNRLDAVVLNMFP